MKGSVKHGTVAALRNIDKSNGFRSMIKLSYRNSEGLVSESRNCDRGCMIRGRSAVLEGAGQTGVVLF